MYILCTYVKCIYHYRGPHGRLAVTLGSYVFAKCCVPLKIKSLLTLLYLLIASGYPVVDKYRKAGQLINCRHQSILRLPKFMHPYRDRCLTVNV